MSNLTQDVGVSRRALSIARMIDRLAPGKYNLYLAKAEGESDRWIVEISQSVTLQKKELSLEAFKASVSAEITGV